VPLGWFGGGGGGWGGLGEVQVLLVYCVACCWICGFVLGLCCVVLLLAENLKTKKELFILTDILTSNKYKSLLLGTFLKLYPNHQPPHERFSFCSKRWSKKHIVVSWK
jgi:hypothetical protein